jgi:ISXO2-like transposase domain
VVPNRCKKSLHSEIKRHVAAGSVVYTDALMSYQDLKSTYAHQDIDHAERYAV